MRYQNVRARGSAFGLGCLGFAALVCVYAGRPKPGNRRLTPALSWTSAEARNYVSVRPSTKSAGLRTCERNRPRRKRQSVVAAFETLLEIPSSCAKACAVFFRPPKGARKRSKKFWSHQRSAARARDNVRANDLGRARGPERDPAAGPAAARARREPGLKRALPTPDLITLSAKHGAPRQHGLAAVRGGVPRLPAVDARRLPHPIHTGSWPAAT